jgi:hypothetical protein
MHTNAHANPLTVWFDAKEDDRYELTVYVDDPLVDSVPDEYYHIQLLGSLDRCLFAFLAGCNTATPGTALPPPAAQNRYLMEGLLAKGVDCVAGFEDSIYTPEVEIHLETFWDEAMTGGASIRDAHLVACLNVMQETGDDGGTGSFWCSNDDMALKPARFGELTSPVP